MKQVRAERGLSLRALASECAALDVPVDFGHLGRVERGQVKPSIDLAGAIAKVIGADISSLFPDLVPQGITRDGCPYCGCREAS